MSNRDRVADILFLHGGSTPELTEHAGIARVTCGGCGDLFIQCRAADPAPPKTAGQRALVDHVVDILDKEGLLA